MGPTDWVEEFEGAITVCDTAGSIVALNGSAQQMFAEDGGAALVGTNVLDCHPPAARATIERLLAERTSNVYLVEKRGERKLIYQAPWRVDGEFRGLLELSLDLPADLPVKVRD
jgi:transcriptional regulator with PAS, ATPase and Fis domain